MRATEINWENGSVEELRLLYRCDEDRITSRRLFALIKLSEGRSVRDVSEIMEVSVSSIQRWIKKFNESGIEGLLNRGDLGGRRRLISVTAFFSSIVPVLEEKEEDYWTAVRLHGYLVDHAIINCSYRTLLRSLHANNYSQVVPIVSDKSNAVLE